MRAQSDKELGRPVTGTEPQGSADTHSGDSGPLAPLFSDPAREAGMSLGPGPADALQGGE